MIWKDQNKPSTGTSENRIPLTENAHSAFENRENFLTSKEECMIKKMLEAFGCGDGFLSEDVKNDDTLASILKSLAYSWEEFSIVKRQYDEEKIWIWKSSSIRSSLEKIEDKKIQIVSYVNNIVKIGSSVDKTMSTMVRS